MEEDNKLMSILFNLKPEVWYFDICAPLQRTSTLFPKLDVFPFKRRGKRNLGQTTSSRLVERLLSMKDY